MKPVAQTILHNPETPEVMGNCVQAVVASILELPLEEVPHFVQQDYDNKGEGNWYWMNLLRQFLKSHNKTLTRLYAPEELATDEQLIVFGDSPRDVGHAVIFQDGKLLHDPHPDKTGLKTQSHIYAIRETQ